MILDRGSRRLGFAGALALALVVAACAKESKPPPVAPGLGEPMPAPATPAMAVRAFEWCWNRRSLDRYQELFTDDFLFECAASDSAGSAFRGGGFTRLDELESARHLFAGGGPHPRATSITLQLDPNLIPQPDGRPGDADVNYHREIVTSAVLRIRTEVDEFQVTGVARFFLVRGDSAQLPAELAAKGAKPDAARWYIERWEDDSWSSAAAALRAQPAKMTTWCSIKALYR